MDLSLFNFLSRFSKEKNCLGMQLGNGFAKISILDKSADKFELPLIPFEISLPENIDDAGELIKEEIEKREIKIGKAVVGLPTNSLFFKTIRIPKVEEKELKEAVEWNIKDDIKTIQGNTFYDFSIISEEDNMLDILVVIAKYSDIDKLKQICEIANIPLEIIDAEPISLINLAKQYKDKQNIEDENICVIHLDKIESYLAFSHKNVIIQNLNFDSLKYEAMTPDERESVVESLVNEINYFFLTIHEPNMIFVSGDSFKFQEIKAYMQLKFGNRFNLMDLDPKEALELDYEGDKSLGEFNIPLALAYRGFIE